MFVGLFVLSFTVWLCFQFYDLFEIAIRQCRSSGIDCKIHGLSIVGHRRPEDEEIITGYSYLASDKVGENCQREVRSDRVNLALQPVKVVVS